MSEDNVKEVVIKFIAQNLTGGDFTELRRQILSLDETQTKNTVTQGQQNTAMKEGASLTDKFRDTIRNFGQEMGLTGTVLSNFTDLAIRYAGPLAAGAAIRESLGWADAMVKLSERTNLSLESIQRFEFAGVQVGVSMDAVAVAIFQLQRRMGDNNSGIIKAFGDIGLNFDTIRHMKPEDQFIAISAALRDIQDPSERSAAAMAIFGRSASEILPLIRSDFQSLADKAPVMADAAIEALHKVSIAIDSLWMDTKHTIANVTGETIIAVGNVIDLIRKNNPGMILGPQGVGGPVIPRLAGPSAPNLGSMLPSGPIVNNAYDISVPLNGQTMAQQSAAAEAAVEFQKWRNEIAAKENGNLSPFMTSIGLANLSHILPGQLDTRFIGNGMATSGPSLFDAPMLYGGASYANRSGFGLGVANIGNKTFSTPSFGDRSGFSGDQFGATVMSAITGGGDVSKSLGGLFGGDVTKGLMGPAVTSGISSILGKTMGGALNSILPGVGSLLGSIGGELIGKLFNQSVTNKPRDAFVADEGGLNNLNNNVMNATGSLQLIDKLNAAKTTDQLTAAMNAVNAAITKYNQEVDKAHQLQDQLSASMKKTLTITPDMQAALERAYNAKNVTDYNSALGDLNNLSDAQVQKQQELDDTLTKYGLTWEVLGPQARAAKLGEHAQELLGDYQRLIDAGVDVGTTIHAMSTELSGVVTSALKTGTEVPISLKPVLEKAAEMGELFDENGNKITAAGLDGIQFGTTMDEALKKVGDVLDRLATVLEERFPAAVKTATTSLNDLTKDRTINIRTNIVPPDGSEPDFSGGFNIEGAASGGLYSDPTMRVIAERGPEIVGAPNAIVDALAAAMQSVGGFGSGGSSDGQPMIVQVMLDGRVLTEQVVKRMPAELARWGLRTS